MMSLFVQFTPDLRQIFKSELVVDQKFHHELASHDWTIGKPLILSTESLFEK